MSKVTTYEGYSVPEGATHFQAQYQDLYAGFYKKIHDAWFFFNCSDSVGWVLEESADDNLHGLSVEIPDFQPEQPKEWQPTIGEECELKYKHSSAADWFPFRLVVTDEGIMFGWSDGEPVNLKHDQYEFRQIRTKKEKDLEHFIIKAYELTMTTDPVLRAVFSIMYECGFTAPEGE